MMGRDGEVEWGANDMQHVVCALGRLFYSLFLLYLTVFFICFRCYNKQQTVTNDRQRWRGEWGSNGMLRVVCAPGSFFSFFIVIIS